MSRRLYLIIILDTVKETTMKKVLKEIGVFILILAFVIFVSSIDSIIDLLLYK